MTEPNTVSTQHFMVRMRGDEEPIVTVRKELLKAADPEDPDQRGLYQVEVRVELA